MTADGAQGAAETTEPRRPWAAKGFAVTAWAFLVTLLVQVFLAGLAIFDSGAWWSTHVGFGYGVVHPVGLVMVVFAFLARPDRRLLGLTAVTALLAFFMPAFATLRGMGPVAALHPVAAIVLFGLGVAIADRSLAFVRTGMVARRKAAPGGA